MSNDNQFPGFRHFYATFKVFFPYTPSKNLFRLKHPRSLYSEYNPVWFQQFSFWSYGIHFCAYYPAIDLLQRQAFINILFFNCLFDRVFKNLSCPAFPRGCIGRIFYRRDHFAYGFCSCSIGIFREKISENGVDASFR